MSLLAASRPSGSVDPRARIARIAVSGERPVRQRFGWTMKLEADQVSGMLGAAAAVIAAPLVKSHGTAADEIAAALVGRLDALAGQPACAGLPEALRQCALQALQVTLSIASGRLCAAPSTTAGPSFHDMAVAWSASTLAALERVSAAPGVRKIRRAAAGPGEPARPTLAQRRLAAEEALLGELDVVLGPAPLPERFLCAFLDAERAGAGWFDAFALYVAGHLRSAGSVTAALGTVPIPPLARLGMTMPQLLDALYAHARRQAQSLEAHLEAAESRPLPAEPVNSEVEQFLARAPRELAAHHGVPAAALVRAATALRTAGIAWTRWEERLDEQARCLASLVRELSPLAQGQGGAAGAVAAAARALALVREGEIVAAREALLRSPAAASFGLAIARLCALAADWEGAKAALNRAIAEPTVRPRARSLDGARELSRVLAAAARPDAHMAAVEICVTLLGAERDALDAVGRAEVLIRLSSVACAMPKGPAQLRALAAAAQAQAAQANGEPPLPLALQARVARAAGDVALALSAHGADRIADAVRAYVAGVPIAAETRDARLASELHVGLADALLASARSAGKDESPRLRAEALAALKAAQTPRLRARDPIWWMHVKRRLAETTLAVARDDPATARSVLWDGIVAAKAALRLMAAGPMEDQRARGLALVGDLFAALGRLETASRWRMHARAAYTQALSGVAAETAPVLWCTIAESRAGLALADGAAADEVQAAVGELRAAVDVAARLPPVRRARIERLLGDALAASGQRRLDLADLGGAAGAYRAALDRLTPQAAPVLWCQCWVGLANVERERAHLGAVAGLVALVCDLETAVALARKGLEPDWIAASLSRELADCRAALAHRQRRARSSA
jgi:hypothetical protein